MFAVNVIHLSVALRQFVFTGAISKLPTPLPTPHVRRLVIAARLGFPPPPNLDHVAFQYLAAWRGMRDALYRLGHNRRKRLGGDMNGVRLAIAHAAIALCTLVALLLVMPTMASAVGPMVEQARLSNAPPIDEEFTMNSIALSNAGNTAVMWSGDGSYTFVRSGSSWVGTNSPGLNESYGEGGAAISLNGNTAIVGGYNEEAGSAAVIVRSAGTWTRQAIFYPPQEGPHGEEFPQDNWPEFGASVAISGGGSEAVVGDGDFVALYGRRGGNWIQSQLFGKSEFGDIVALSADGLTFAHDGGSGVEIWTRGRKGFVEQAQLSVPSRYGPDVALSEYGETLLAGTRVYVRSGAIWTLQAELSPAGGETTDALSLTGNVALIGYPEQKRVREFVRSGSAWTEMPEPTVTSETVPSEWRYGSSVALSGNGREAIIGAESGFESEGGAWAFTEQRTP